MKKKMQNEYLLWGAAGLAIVGMLLLKKRNGTDSAATNYSAADDESLPQGYRNNNPLNIIISPEQWQGKLVNNTDGKYEQFSSMLYGYRAAFRNLHTYMAKYGLNTIAAIINRWAPPTENPTQQFIDYVSNRIGVAPDRTISYSDKQTMCNLVYAMAEFENGTTPATEAAGLPNMSLIQQAYDLAA